jgi:hypothetical protein
LFSFRPVQQMQSDDKSWRGPLQQMF